MVLAEARACRFCGYDPEVIAAAEAANTRAAERDYDSQVTLVLAVAALVFIAATAAFLAIWVW